MKTWSGLSNIPIHTCLNPPDSHHGYMIFSRRGFFRTYLGRKEEPGPKSGQASRVGVPLPTHMEDFLNCVRNRQPTKANADIMFWR